LRWLPVVVSTILWPALMCGAFWARFGVEDFVRELAMGACLGHLAGRRIDRALRRSGSRATPA
jgi:hypothetical protein